MFPNISNNDFKVAIYIRLSREDGDKAESESVSNQRNMIMKYIDDNNFNFVDEYIDDGISGTTFDRPGFIRMINDIETGKINMVITKDLSRLGRDYIKTGYYIENYFPENMVRYIAILDNLDTYIESAATDITPFKAVLNDMYAKDISKKIRSVFKQKKESGKYISTYPPYGYQKDINNIGALTVDPYACGIVKRVFEMYISGIGQYKISKIFNSENIPSPGLYLNMTVKNKTENFDKWKASSVRTILKNEVYLGTLLQGKTKKLSYKSKKTIALPREIWITHENAHSPIIDVETFDKAQKIMASRVNTRNRGRDYLLKGLLYCHNCKNKMQIVTKTERYKDRQYERTYVICNKANHYPGECEKQYHNYTRLETEILNYIKEICKTYIDSDLYRKAILKKNNNKDELIADYEDHIKLLYERAEQINEKLDKIYSDRLDGNIEEQDYLRYSKKLLEERKSNEDSMNTYKEKIKRLEGQDEQTVSNSYIRQVVSNFLNSKNINKEILLDILDRIEIDRDKNVYIHFNFAELNVYDEVHQHVS